MRTHDISFRHNAPLTAVEIVTEKAYSIIDDCGTVLYHMARETGVTPNGNAVNRRWVLRKPDGTFVMVDQHRHDIFDRIGHVLVD